MATDAEIKTALEEVVDPEIHLSIVELGLVREIDQSTDPVVIRMLLTYRIDCIQVLRYLIVNHRTRPSTLLDSAQSQSSKFQSRRAGPSAHEIWHPAPGHGKE